MNPPARTPSTALPVASAQATPRLSLFWRARLAAGLVFIGCFGVLMVANLLHASASGMGTHQQLGLPACGFASTVGLPCATCGYTTAFTHAAHGHLWLAFKTQPAGAVFAVLTAAACLVSAWALATGASLTPIASRIWRPRTIVILGVTVLASWLYKILIVSHVF